MQSINVTSTFPSLSSNYKKREANVTGAFIIIITIIIITIIIITIIIIIIIVIIAITVMIICITIVILIIHSFIYVKSLMYIVMRMYSSVVYKILYKSCIRD
ncbi:hypothetical protein PUN28_020412 [Cardiocondyla obscurior]|uniref:ABC transmembrane type-1 domain-containing protein n=1 Tax=Cardiocondyla obscurior TaxID=286306 RepID=A0AAW2E853_9HYME